MKKVATLVLLCIGLLFNKAYAQPSWSVNAGSFNYSMTVTGVINLDYIEEMDAANMVGAFVGAECRGVAQPIFDAQVNRYVVYLLVYSNSTSETVDFQVYDASTDAIISIPVTLTFSVNGIIGSAEQPYVWSNPTLSSDADILTFSFPGQSAASTFDGTNINVTMPFGTDLTALVADFTSSLNASISVNSVAQTSGITSNDFTNPVVYFLVAADGTTQQTYTVSVSVANGTPSDIVLSTTDIAESTVASTVVAVLSTTDIDAGDTHVYSFVTGSGDADNSAFSISGADLTINNAPDYETKTSYSVRLRTEDLGGAFFEKQITLNVVDENDEIPQVTAATVQLLETTLVGEQVHPVLASDKDANSTLVYSITNGNTGTAFSINSSTGAIITNSALDYETTTSYSLEISVFDGVNTGVGIVTINVVDVNDETPVVSDATVGISESTTVSTLVHTVAATDADNGSVLNYAIVSGNGASRFTINSSTGAITLVQALNFELVQIYYLSVAVSDGEHTGTAELIFNVVDENDETPEVAEETVYVSENENIGFSITTVSASDADANSVFSYAIVSGNAEGNFAIDPASGEITLAGVLNYEITSAYSLGINVSDGLNSNIGYTTINIQAINDEFPTIASAVVTINESSIVLQTVHQVVASDPDGGSVLEYSILSGNTGSAFQIDPAFGIITVIGTLNYETVPSYNLVVNVDDGLHETTAVITVNINNENDETPIVQAASVAIDEDLAAGLQVTQVSASDPDGMSSLTYSILAGNAGAAFAIESSTGIITLANSVDYENITQYQLTVGVNDGVETGTASITVTINDVNDETPVAQSGNNQIPETASLGSSIFTVVATDADQVGALNYTITSGNSEGKFEIDPSTGEITLIFPLDFETTTDYTLTVNVSDGVQSTTCTVEVNVIDINDEIPVVQSEIIFVAENTNIGTTVYSMQATDDDANSELTYNIYSGNEMGKFSINMYSGALYLVSSIDYETQTSYTLEVIVSDGVNSSIGQITLMVNDVNDNPPVVQDAETSVLETTSLASPLFTVAATDLDANSVFGFSILFGNTEGAFIINPNTGVISLADELDYETITDYLLQVEVSDGLNKATALITLLVVDENDEIPALKDTTIKVSEFAAIDDIIVQLSATDKDANSTFTFSLVSADTEGFFAVATTGEISVTDYLDFETTASYKLTVKVSDGVNESTGTITIEIIDGNEETFNAVNVFTPNNDNINEFWEVGETHLYRDCEFNIYNGIGELVYNSIGYNNDWAGTSSSGEPLPVGTYYYVVSCPNCEACAYQGFVSIVR